MTKTHIVQSSLLRLTDPRVIRALLVGLILVLMLLTHSSAVFACPIGCGSGCGGG